MEQLQKAWWKEAVVYQIYPRSFQDSDGDGVGDLPGILRRLDYIERLGVDVIWLCPIYRSPNDDNGYDISDYREIMAEFGTMEDFERLLGEAHRRGLRVVMDLVVNHTSDEHPWFVESRSSRDNPRRDYYIWRPGQDGGPPAPWKSRFSGSAWELDEASGMYYLHSFSKKQPDLNWDNPQVRREVYDLMRFWLEKGVDGFRMDVIDRIGKPESLVGGYPPDLPLNLPKTHRYLQEMHEQVLARYDMLTVGEASSLTVEEAKRFAGFDRGELQMMFHFEHMHIENDEKGKWNDNRFSLRELRRILSRWQTGLDGVAWNSLYWDNHDQPRVVSRFGDDSTPLLREKSAKMLALCLHLMQGTPYIYQGEELGMTNAPFAAIEDCRDIESRNAYRERVGSGQATPEEMMRYIRRFGRDNARTPMQWDDSPNAGFTEGEPWLAVNPNHREINAAAQEEDPDSVLQFYRRLIALRKQHEIIVYGHYELLGPEDDRLFCYLRRLHGKQLLVACNFTGETVDFAPPAPFGPGTPLLLGNYPGDGSGPLRPYEARAWLLA